MCKLTTAHILSQLYILPSYHLASYTSHKYYLPISFTVSKEANKVNAQKHYTDSNKTDLYKIKFNKNTVWLLFVEEKCFNIAP